MDAHGSSVQVVGVGVDMQLPDKRCEVFLPMFADSGVESNVSDVLPQRRVNVVRGSPKLGVGVW